MPRHSVSGPFVPLPDGAPVVPGYYELPWVFIAQLESIRCETYIKSGRRATLYALPGYAPAALRDRAAEGAVFLVRTGDMTFIRRDLAQALERTLANPSIAPITRSKTAYAIATAITVPALAGPRPSEDDLAVVRATVESLTRILLAAPEELWRLCSVLQADARSHTHAVNVAVLTLVMAREAGIGEEDSLREIGLGAFLHDLGAARRAPGPAGPTLRDELRARQHPARGAAMLRAADGTAPAFARFVAEHHERWDGTGFPAGLAGDRISLPGRLLAIVSAFDAGLGVAEDGAGRTPYETLSAMRNDPGGFDPVLLRQFIEVLGGRNLLQRRPAA